MFFTQYNIFLTPCTQGLPSNTTSMGPSVAQQLPANHSGVPSRRSPRTSLLGAPAQELPIPGAADNADASGRFGGEGAPTSTLMQLPPISGADLQNRHRSPHLHIRMVSKGILLFSYCRCHCYDTMENVVQTSSAGIKDRQK